MAPCVGRYCGVLDQTSEINAAKFAPSVANLNIDTATRGCRRFGTVIGWQSSQLAEHDEGR
jgi:hypothetical protein